MSPLTQLTPGYAMSKQRKRKTAPTRFITEEASDNDMPAESDSDDSLFELRPLKKLSKKGAITRKKLQKSEAQLIVKAKTSENRFARLPGELKNMIYELVLHEPAPVELGKGKREPAPAVRRLCYCRQHYRYITPRRSVEERTWREPGLLSVSKEIRAEASVVYYSGNSFRLPLNKGKIEQACAWLSAKHDLHQPTMADYPCWINFKFNLISAPWEGVRSWFAISKVAHHITSDEADYDCAKEFWHNRLVHHPRHPIWVQTKNEKFRELLAMGAKAKIRGLDLEALKDDFDEWIVSMQTASQIDVRSVSEL